MKFHKNGVIYEVSSAVQRSAFLKSGWEPCTPADGTSPDGTPPEDTPPDRPKPVKDKAAKE